jgi:hypothetical protein
MATFQASGNISPKRFVCIDPTYPLAVAPFINAGGQVVQASLTSVPIIGISQPSTRLTNYQGLDDGYAAIAGQELVVYQSDAQAWDGVLLTLGTGGCSAGDRLTTDGSGQGIVVSGDGQYIGAQAMNAGLAGQDVLVQPYRGQQAS